MFILCTGLSVHASASGVVDVEDPSKTSTGKDHNNMIPTPNSTVYWNQLALTKDAWESDGESDWRPVGWVGNMKAQVEPTQRREQVGGESPKERLPQE